MPGCYLRTSRLACAIPCYLKLTEEELPDKFMAQMKARLEFIRSGEYKTVFHYPAVIFAYVTAKASPTHSQTQSKNDGLLDADGVI